MRRKNTSRHSDRKGLLAPPLLTRSLGWTTSVLLKLAQELRKSRKMEATLQAVTWTAVELTRSFQGTLRLLDDSGSRLLLSARTGPSVHRRGAVPFRVGEGFIGWVVVHRQPAISNHVDRDPRFVAREGQVWTPLAIMAVPLLTSRHCIGVLSVSRKEQLPYQPMDMELLQLVAELSVPYLEIARLKHLNETDPLTLLYNRRHLQMRLPLEIQRSRRNGSPLSLAMVDLDHFKKVNDVYGHDLGDEVLEEVGRRLKGVCRGSDVVTRFGGEEFLLIFPETNLQQAKVAAERLRQAIGNQPFLCSCGPIQVTASVGLARLRQNDTPQSLERRADQAMYAAKHRGRNRVVVLSRPARQKTTKQSQ